MKCSSIDTSNESVSIFNTISEHETRIDILIQMRQAMIQLIKEAAAFFKDWNGSSIDRINDIGSRIGTTNESGSIIDRKNERGSTIDTTNERDSDFDIAKETIEGINTIIYEKSVYSDVTRDENSAESNGTTVDNNTVTNVTTNKDENDTDINIIGILKNQYLKKKLRLKWMS